MIAQRNALLAWTGQGLKLMPRVNRKMVSRKPNISRKQCGEEVYANMAKSLAHWGNTQATGRGLLALTGKGLIHQIHLKTGDEYIIHPSNVIAYSIMQHPPQPYRFKSSSLRFQIPNPFTWLPDTRFWRTMRETTVWKIVRDTAFTLRTWTRRTIWGDRVRSYFPDSALHLLHIH